MANIPEGPSRSGLSSVWINGVLLYTETEGDRRILLGNNIGDRAVMLWPIRFQFVQLDCMDIHAWLITHTPNLTSTKLDLTFHNIINE